MAGPEVAGVCCIIDQAAGTRCSSPATVTSFSKRILQSAAQKWNLQVETELGGGGGGVCEDHSFILYSMRPKRKRKESEEENDFQPEVDFLQLQMNTLRRYKRHYKLQLKPGTNKIQLVEAISKHFKTIRVTEKKAVPLFISMVKSHKSKLDQPKPPETS